MDFNAGGHPQFSRAGDILAAAIRFSDDRISVLAG